MDTEEPINPELLEPWHEIEVPYETFQSGMWQHEETAEVIVAEAQQGPFSGRNPEYDILLLPNDEVGAVPKASLEEGIGGPEQAVHEAQAIIATGKVEEYADGY